MHASGNIEVVRGLVARGLGWTHVLQRWPLDVSLEGLPLVCVPIAGDVSVYRVVAAWPEQDHHSRRAAAVVSFLHEVALSMPDPGVDEPGPGVQVARSDAPGNS